jgi:ankyrin repeat protein
LVMDDTGKVYLVDFGAVQETYYNTFMRGSTMVGTFGYMAPEQFRGQAVPQTDLYALGATVLFLLTHRSPAELPQERLRVSFRSHVNVSDAFADWLERCLEPDLEDRMPSAKEALALLQGRFVMPNWRRVVPWRMVAGLGAASAVAWFGFDTFKYELLQLTGLTGADSGHVICRAVRAEDVGAVRSFMRFGNKGERITQLIACGYTSNKMLRVIVESGGNVDATVTGYLLLHSASPRGGNGAEDVEIVKFLLDKGANVDAKDHMGRTPLTWATGLRLLGTMTLLLDRGANVNATDRSGATPLHFAIQNFARHNVPDSAVMPPAANYMPWYPYPFRKSGHINDSIGNLSNRQALKLLIAKGADVNATYKGLTPLHLAVATGSVETAKLLIAKGANINAKDNDGLTSLHWAARAGSVALVKLLVDKGADVNATDRNGSKPLSFSVHYSPEIAALLRSHGAK